MTNVTRKKNPYLLYLLALLNIIRVAVSLVFIVVGVVSIGAFFSDAHAAFEYLSHLRPMWCLAAGILAALLLALKCRRMAALAAVVLAVNLAPIAKLYIPTGARAEDGNARISILQLNVWGGKNRHPELAVAAIKAADADVVGISEVTSLWMPFLKYYLPEYPYVIAEDRFGGIAVFSKLPLKDAQVKYYSKINRPRIQTRFKVGDRMVTLLFIHPVTPFHGVHVRNGEFDVVAADAMKVIDSKEPLILAGDLNCTPWSAYFDKLAREAHVQDTERGYGVQPTWNAFWKVTIFPIDHCLATDDFITVRRTIGERIGSDHLPVMTELSLRSQPLSQEPVSDRSMKQAKQPRQPPIVGSLF